MFWHGIGGPLSERTLRATALGTGWLLVLSLVVIAVPLRAVAAVRPAAQPRRVHPLSPDLRFSELSATTFLRAHRIRWRSNGNCSDRMRSVCTSFQGIRWGSLTGLADFQRRSRCPIMVSGGTETGHAKQPYSHWHGFKMDIMPTPCVDEFIEHHFRYAGIRKDGSPMYVGPFGYTYADENSTHWDIVFTAAWHPSDHDMAG